MQVTDRTSLKQQLRLEAAEAILDAAERVVASEGIGGASMQRVAREARVSVGTLYNYFGDRDGLLRQLVLRHRRDEMTVVGPPTGAIGAITGPNEVVDWRDKV